MPSKSKPKPKPKSKPKTKVPPKAAPRQVVAKTEIEGPAPMSQFDFKFCQIYVETGKQSEAFRQLAPEHKHPRAAALRMMQRPEIREHIRAIFKKISSRRDEAAQISATAVMLSLEVADSRLVEVLNTRRRTRGEMLTRDVRMLLVEGTTPEYDEKGKLTGYTYTPELAESMVKESSPIEDADLLKAIKLTYDRKQGIIKADKPVDPGVANIYLYRPAWYGNARTIEADA